MGLRKKALWFVGGLFILAVILWGWQRWCCQPTGRIAFHSNRSGRYQIWVMDANGRNQTQLTNLPGNNTNPSWSPDGQYILFCHRLNKVQSLQIIQIDKGGLRALTLRSSRCTSSWSPDGQWIAFVREVNSRRALFKIHLDGSDEQHLASLPSMDIQDPSWTANVDKIVFTAFNPNTGHYQLFLLDQADKKIEALTSLASEFADPDLSPDGKIIAYNTLRPPRLYLKNLSHGSTALMFSDGLLSVSLKRYLPFNPIIPTIVDYFNPHLYFPFPNDSNPSWALNGEFLAFQRRENLGDDLEICVSRTDGSQLNCLTENRAHDGAPDWWMPTED